MDPNHTSGQPTNSVPADVHATYSAGDEARLVEYFHRLKSEQNLVAAMVAGFIAALVGAFIWAVVTVVTEFQIGWMAVGVGFLVGYAVRVLGKGLSSGFGMVGAVCALGGCVLGNVLSGCGFVAKESQLPLAQVVMQVLLQPAVAWELLLATFSPMDLLFYGIAVYEGYKFSFRQIDEQQIAALATQPTPAKAPDVHG